MHIPLLNDIILIFALAIGVVYLCQKLRIPSVVGFLITGVLAGPHGLGLVSDIENVEAMAEIGIILLLFTIGIEFSLRQLLQIRRSVLLGGTLQVTITILVTAIIMAKTGSSWGEAMFIGFLIALSSTAIVLKLIQDRSEVDTPHGRNTLGILIFQDIVIIPMMLFTPILAQTAVNLNRSPLLLLLQVILVLLFVFVSARWIAPFLFYHIARQKSRELFLISIVTMGLAVAWLTSNLGLSISLGAFLAGLIISESEYSHQALGNILPFRDVFTSIFFVSVGMLFNMDTFLQHPLVFLAVTLGILLGKSAVAGLVIILMGFPLRTAVLAGMALGQVGEFSFILSRVGLDYKLLSPEFYQMFIIVSVLTMAITPFSINASPRFARVLLKLPLPSRLKTGVISEPEIKEAAINDHLVIIGFGVNGKNLARAAAASGIPYVILEMNPDIIKEARRDNEPIYYGDATQAEVLHQVNLGQARVVVIAISDPAATVRICDLIRKTNPHVHIIVRTRYIQEIAPLYKVGANDVIPEEFETSVEIFTLVLKKYLVPRVDIDNFIAEIRADGYEMLRSLSKKSPTLQDIKLHYHDAEIANLRIEKGAWAAGKTLAEMELRSRHGASLLLIQRGLETIINPDGDTRLQEDDQVVLLGTPDIINAVAHLFDNINEVK
ncbi:monovalent cation:proton antiporter family protein [Syntrophomonas palmitatica]|uniref:monovalent cation:proton antiporter family protein n=1 Tax=Syntrophomonas palmitatica TaxID=402877 RepID=UPI0006CF7655|nr:monovalent cation:proton antiporter family protein [Syntrophomonas palmitatica]